MAIKVVAPSRFALVAYRVGSERLTQVRRVSDKREQLDADAAALNDRARGSVRFKVIDRQQVAAAEQKQEGA